MHLKILLPTRVFADATRRIADRRGDAARFVRTAAASARLRGRARAGILIYETPGDGEVFLAVDEGVLVKTGPDVLVSVRRAVGGTDLGALHKAVEQEFLTLNEQEQSVRSVMDKMEVGFLSRLAAFRHE